MSDKVRELQEACERGDREESDAKAVLAALQAQLDAAEEQKRKRAEECEAKADLTVLEKSSVVARSAELQAGLDAVMAAQQRRVPLDAAALGAAPTNGLAGPEWPRGVALVAGGMLGLHVSITVFVGLVSWVFSPR
jgi:hypothetical protein